MQNEKKSYLEQAAAYWRGDQPLKAGELIFENLPTMVRPRWAGRILRLVVERSGIQSPLLDEVLHTAEDPATWGSAHRLFSSIRGSVLELDRLQKLHGLTKEQEVLHWVLSVAELVAKVTYNATDPPDEFDEDSGWWMASLLRSLVDYSRADDEFPAMAWAALCWVGD